MNGSLTLIHTRTHARTHAGKHARTHTHTHTHTQTNTHTHSLILTGYLLTDWMTGTRNKWVNGPITHSFHPTFLPSFMHSLLPSFLPSFIQLLTDSLTTWLAGWLAGWFTHLLYILFSALPCKLIRDDKTSLPATFSAIQVYSPSASRVFALNFSVPLLSIV